MQILIFLYILPAFSYVLLTSKARWQAIRSKINSICAFFCGRMSLQGIIMQITEDAVISRLRDSGHRITSQKSTIIRNILDNPNSTAKEIYYLSKEKSPGINLSTVYRTVSELEKIGLLGNRNISFCAAV